MTPLSDTTRRSFLVTGAASALAQSPNDTLRLGLIGAGGRARDLLQEIVKSGEKASITAVCDVWRVNRESMSEMVSKQFGAAPKQTTRYEELLSWKDVDAVLIATPDFTHPRILADAVAAGKDAYCEKPFATDLDDARLAYHAVKKSDRVVQVGTQRRSDAGLIGVADFIRSGKLGKVTRVDLQVHFNEPRWRRDFHMIKGEDIDWEAFRFHGRIKGPFDARKFREWQLFRETTNGIPGLWMSHLIDLAAWFLDDPYPRSAVTAGGVYLWKDGRQTSDMFHTLIEYNDCLVSFVMSLTNSAGWRNLWYGTKGTLDADALKASGDGAKDAGRLMETVAIPKVEVESHMANFLRCMRTRQTPRASVQAGFSHAVAGILSVAALESGRRVKFDAGTLEMA
jgi:predicted dehydrogenase